MIVPFFILTVTLCFFQLSSNADEFPVDWRSSKAASQGGAGTAFSNDETAIYSNPAGLSEIRNPSGKEIISDIRMPLIDEAGANEQMISSMEPNPDNWVSDLISSAKNNQGSQSYLELQSFPYMIFGTRKGKTAYLFGFPVRSENKVAFVDTTNPNNAVVQSVNTASAAFAVGFTSAQGGVRLGISARPNYRMDYETTTYDSTKTSTGDYVNTVSDNGIKTSAVGIDAGMTFTAADFWFPTFGFSVRNIPTGCASNYVNPVNQQKITMCGSVRQGGSDSSPNVSRVDPTEIRAGVSLVPRFRVGKSVLNLKVSFDAYPLSIQSGDRYYGIADVDSDKLLHTGGELYFGNAFTHRGFSLRGGYTNGSATWGASVNVLFFYLEYASYFATDTLTQTTGVVTVFSERRHFVSLTWHL